MLKAIAAGAALICAALAWLVLGVAMASVPKPPFSPETIGTTAGMMSILGVGLIVISPFIGLFNWARK